MVLWIANSLMGIFGFTLIQVLHLTKALILIAIMSLYVLVVATSCGGYAFEN